MTRYNVTNLVELSDEDKENLFLNTITLRPLSDSEGKWEIVYGFDNAMGYFLQLWPVDEKAITWFGNAYNWDEECFDFDSIYHGLTGPELAYFLQMVSGNTQHIEMAYLDLSF